MAKEKKGKKKKKTDLEQYERISITAGKAPTASLVFIGMDCWKVLPRKASDPNVDLWRLKQAGGDEVIHVPATQEVMIQKMYLDQES
jgi:hypothetical protein